jgi:multiple sugar transport system permease protein
LRYLFISPWLIAFFAFTFIPIIASFLLAFTNYDVLNPSWGWVGLQNFERMFTRDPRYIKALQATFFYAFMAIPLRLIFALAIAMLLNTNRRMVSDQRTFVSLQMGYASAMAWVLLAIIAIMTALVFRSSSYWVFYGSQEE